MRLNKRMAELGLASRREADDWIGKGWVKVNGQVAEMGMQVAPDVRIEIDRLAKGQQANQVTVLINKPLGLVSGQAEDGHEPAITLVQPQNRWAEDNARFFFHGSQLKSLVPAGRLDIDSTGLLVLTQDGRVARQLIGEDSVMEKEYLVRVIYTGVLNTAAATSAAATYAARPAPPTQLSRIDDDDPVSHRCAIGLSPRQTQAAAPWSESGRPGPEARQGGMAKPRAAAFCTHRGQEAPDSPHVRAGGPESGGPQARARGQCDAGQPAAGAMALSGAA
jgi:16S rRNA U516 pseudouridylate synthase RsuA-like enzyme